MSYPTILDFIRKVETNYLRTNIDAGATENALLMLNTARSMIGMPNITIQDLPKWNGEKYVMPPNSNLLANKKPDYRASDELVDKIYDYLTKGYITVKGVHMTSGLDEPLTKDQILVQIKHLIGDKK